jgi:hypothetical protein
VDTLGVEQQPSCPALGRTSTKAKAQRQHIVVDGPAKPGHDAVGLERLIG